MIIEALKKSFVGKTWTFIKSFKTRYQEKFVIPPYSEKRAILSSYQKKFQLTTMVETGTFLGDTVAYFKEQFARIYSIELAEDLAKRAQQRFSADPHVSIIQGDSSKVLEELVKQFDAPVMFWLDGHYSSEFFLNGEYIVTAKGEKETPIERELEIVLGAGQKHVVLIDDARLFIGKDDYPTMRSLKEKVKSLRPEYQIEVKRDIIRITP